MRRGDSFRGRTALAASLAAGFFSLVPVAAEAGFTRVQTIDGGGHKTLSDQTIYIIADDDISATGGTGTSAYTVRENATAVLYIPAGKKLTLKGGAGSGVTGAGAGIAVPTTSTLVVTGEGKLVVTGGSGANGGNGGDGGSASRDGDWFQAGSGGNGGNGGGGGSAASASTSSGARAERPS